MKKFLIIAGCIIIIVGCNRTRRTTGHAYMPDMVYSVAYETYAPTEERLAKYQAHFNNQPVEGAIARGDAFPYKFKNDSLGYAQSATVVNPISSPMNSKDYLEASRLYLVNCGICHGAKLDGMGPLYGGGNGPFTAAPKNFMDAAMKAMPEGTMFHSVTYGKNAMGSYASQLNTTQRWMIIAYIKDKQKNAGGTPAAGADSTIKAGAQAPADSSTQKGKL